MPHPVNPEKGTSLCRDAYIDVIHIVDGEGRLLKKVSIIDALLESPYAPILRHTTDPCDPMHLNSVYELSETVGDGIGPGDLVASLRNISAFVILDKDTYRLKRLIRGTFFGQHSVKHLKGSRFLMLDNWGREGTFGPSRLLMVDIANGAETTIIPNDSTPEHLRSLFVYWGGEISLSPDLRRVFVTFGSERKAVEVRIRDGAVLTVFHSVHDVSHLAWMPEERKTRAAAFMLRPIHYIEKGGEAGHERRLSKE